MMHFFRKYWQLIIITLVGLGLRLWNLTAISLWHDEAFSALLIKYSWSEMMYRIGLDVHPPMYYVFLRVWHYGFGDSLWSLRAMSVFFGVAAIVATYAFVHAAFKNKTAALIAALLVAISPFQIQYVTEARMYTMGAFFAILAAYFLVKALETEKTHIEHEQQYMPNLPQDMWLKKASLLYYLLFALSISVIMYTHYYLFFTAAALGLYGLIHHLRYYKDSLKRYWPMLGSFALIGLLYIPWVKIFLFQFRQVGGNYWIPPMDRWSIPSTLWTMLLGIGVDVSRHTTQYGLIALTAIVVLILIRMLWKTDGKAKWLVIMNILAPFAGAMLFFLLARLRGETSSVYLVRYFLFTTVFINIAMALWLTTIRTKWFKMLILILYAGVNLFAVYHFWDDMKPAERPGMAAAVRVLESNVEPSHKLYVGSSFEFFNLKYYISQLNKPDFPRPLLFSGGNRDIKNMPHFAGTAILTNDDLLPDFAEATKKGDTIWLLWTNGFGGSKPETPKNWEQIAEYSYPEIRPYVGTWIIVTEYKVN